MHSVVDFIVYEDSSFNDKFPAKEYQNIDSKLISFKTMKSILLIFFYFVVTTYCAVFLCSIILF